MKWRDTARDVFPAIHGGIAFCPRQQSASMPKLKGMLSGSVQISSAPTLLLLQVQYGGRAAIPLEQIVSDFFPHLNVRKFLRKALAGQIRLPILRVEASQKSQKFIHLSDLAAYLDERWAAAIKERDQLCGPP